MQEYETRELKISDIILPHWVRRGGLNEHHVKQLMGALETRAELPLPLVRLSDMTCIYGEHRIEAHKRLFGPDVLVKCRVTDIDDFGAWKLAALENARSKLPLSPWDLVYMSCRALSFGMELDELSTLINVPEARLQAFSKRVAYTKTETGQTETVALKYANRHLAGSHLSPAQYQANEEGPGRDYTALARELARAIESGAVSHMLGERARLALLRLLQALAALNLNESWEDEGEVAVA